MGTTPSPPRPRPRTQAERRAETRAALLDATIESLVTCGYGKTTTVRIAELAGVTRGAQLSYFRNRAELVAAAVSYLAERRIEAVRERFTEKPMSLGEGLDAIWNECQGPVFDASLELWVASRTDPELRKEMVRLERQVLAAILREAEAALGKIARRPDFTDNVVFALATIRGLALLEISNGDSGRAKAERWRETRARLLRIFEAED